MRATSRRIGVAACLTTMVAAQPTVPPARVAVAITPDTVVIGQPFLLTVRVRAPSGATISFPTGPDSAAAVDALDPRVIVTTSTRTTPESTATTATYRLAAWDLGRQALAMGPVVVHVNGADRGVPLANLSITVRATAAADSATRRPRPARPFFPERPSLWWLWAVAVSALLAILALWLIVRWWRRRPKTMRGTPEAAALAAQELAALDRLGLIEAGEQGRYVSLLAEITRTFLSRQVPAASLAFTSTELVDAIRSDARVPIERVRTLLTDCDLVKFAQRSVSSDQARVARHDAESVIAEVAARVRAADAARTAAPPSSQPGPRASGPRASGPRAAHRGQAA